MSKCPENILHIRWISDKKTGGVKFFWKQNVQHTLIEGAQNMLREQWRSLTHPHPQYCYAAFGSVTTPLFAGPDPPPPTIVRLGAWWVYRYFWTVTHLRWLRRTCQFLVLLIIHEALLCAIFWEHTIDVSSKECALSNLHCRAQELRSYEKVSSVQSVRANSFSCYHGGSISNIKTSCMLTFVDFKYSSTRGSSLGRVLCSTYPFFRTHTKPFRASPTTTSISV